MGFVRGRLASLACGVFSLLLICRAAAAGAGLGAGEPMLRLETGMHSAPIRAAAVDAAGTHLATAGEDKTARVWDIGSGKLLVTLRPPIAPGREGALDAVAIAPDG